MDGTPYDISLDLWGDGKPDGGSSDKCALTGSTEQWYDVSCYHTQRYICKRGEWGMIINMHRDNTYSLNMNDK